MKTVYKCDGCKAEFDSKKACDEHEQECCSRENLLKRIHELESRIETLELELKLKDMQTKPITVPSIPWEPVNPYPSYPYVPSKPWMNPDPIWCDASKGNAITLTVDSQTEKKSLQ